MACDSAHWSAAADSLPGSATTITLLFAGVEAAPPPRPARSIQTVDVTALAAALSFCLRKMANAEANWERLVRAALRMERLGTGRPYGQPVSGIAGNVPSCLANNIHIDEILRAADEIQDEDPNISRILCEHAYSLAQNLDPNSEGRGVLQFKTGLMSVIRQKLAKREDGIIDHSQDIARLQEFYKRYREKHKVDELCEDEMKLRESGIFSDNLGELERKTLKRKKIFATLKVLGTVVSELTRDMKRVMQSDAAMSEDVVPYNIIPLDAPSITNVITSFPEIKAAISSLKNHSGLPRLPDDFLVPSGRSTDMLDFLQYVFGFQRDNVSNQREHVILLLANAQSRLGSLSGNEPMARELDEILRGQNAQPANSCKTEDGVSFLDQVISPLYEVIAAEAANNDNGQAAHSAWRNYDDFNEYFWSILCFQLDWPWRSGSPFFLKPVRRSKALPFNTGSKHHGKTSFVEHRTFLHLYHSFHRLWIFLFIMFQGLTIIAFNKGHLNLRTVKQLLSIGPTYAVMKLLESVLDILMMYGAYSTSHRSAVSRITCRFLWFTFVTILVGYLFVKALQDGSDSFFFKIYALVIVVYAVFRLFLSSLTHIPSFHQLMEPCNRWSLIRLLKWMHQEHHFVGRGMYERTTDYLKYLVFWLVVLGGKFSFAYFLLIRPLVSPTQVIVNFDNLKYSWHDFFSKHNHNAFYNSEFVGASLLYLSIRYPVVLHAFMEKLHLPLSRRKELFSSGQVGESKKFDAARFAPFWNEIIKNLRDEDYITNLEMDLLVMPKNSAFIALVQWPLFLLASKIFLAKDFAVECRDSQDELWDRISRDEYMKYAVEECYYCMRTILMAILEFDREGRMCGNLDVWNEISKARAESRLFSNLKWPSVPELKAQIKRLHSLLTIKESAANIPRNLEARRRLEFFTNSLFMRMPDAKPVSEMLSFSVFTPYYSEIVLYSVDELQKKNEDGITILFYLQKIFPDEWRNFLSRIGRPENAADSELFSNQNDLLELRFWASYRGQTLARTVRGMMYYRKALMLQHYLEKLTTEGLEGAQAASNSTGLSETHGFELSPEARAQADIKFTYVVTCQIYGKQREEQKPEAADIARLMQRNEALRIAYIDGVESVKDGKPCTEYFSKLVKADVHGKDKEIYSIKLPGNPKLGEGKPENQNHAIIFTRGNALQTIDMNQ
ncbi:hypothetical protein HPP92_022343, partial [Vanilla planifolia]